MYKVYWWSHLGLLHKVMPESEVKEFIDILDRLGWPVDKVEMI